MPTITSRKTSMKTTIKPQVPKGYVVIAGKKVSIGSIESSPGTTPRQLMKALREAAEKGTFPPPPSPSYE